MLHPQWQCLGPLLATPLGSDPWVTSLSLVAVAGADKLASCFCSSLVYFLCVLCAGVWGGAPICFLCVCVCVLLAGVGGCHISVISLGARKVTKNHAQISFNQF